VLPRAFCESLLGNDVVLDDAESHHLLHVLRLKPGAALCLFDGCGTEADAVVTGNNRREVFCSVTTRRSSPRALGNRVTVIVAPPKPDRLKWMVEKLTEIGVERLILLQTERTIVTPGESRIDKLRASVINACKQCRRNELMHLSPLQPLTSLLDDISAQRLPGKLWIAHPVPITSDPIPEPDSPVAPDQSQLLLIGPEGGFTEAEVSSVMNAGAQTVSWPNTILRIETAAIVFAAQLQSMGV
jgi:16S rRNA (uracil1498-N3)-methyltransferase